MLGTVFGMYVAQNYDVPSLEKLYHTGLLIANFYEANYHKSRNKDEMILSMNSVYRDMV